MERKKYINRIENEFKVHPAVALLGPRQVGKTTLAQAFIKKQDKSKVQYFDLENPGDLNRLSEPMLLFEGVTSTLIVIDEIQRRPELFPILRVLIDQKKKNRFLILGSASRDLIRQSSESLAGRIGYIEVTPFSLAEVKNAKKLWLQGGMPLSFLAKTEEASITWRNGYISTFLERDIPALGFQIPPLHLRRFWMMLAHYHGQIVNASELGRSLGLSDHTIKRYIDILVGTFMIRILPPWFENIGKRQVKSQKMYFCDSGILHALIGISGWDELEIYPRLGSFWEGFALEEVIQQLEVQREECFFWATQGGAELDLLIFKNGKRLGFEFKYTDSPKITPSMKIALEDLKLHHLWVVIPGKQTYPLSHQITVHGLESALQKHY
jgi:uncharacterized protein